VIDKQKAA